MKILIVDDNVENIDLLIKVLDQTDGEFQVATSGEKALKVTENKCPDIVLLDVNMPGIDGYETCRRLRKMYTSDTMAIIFVTAYQDQISEGFAAGGDDYITKPINNDEVLSRLNHHYEKLKLTKALKTLNHELEDKVKQRTKELHVANRHLREEINERRYIQDRLRYFAEHDFISKTYNRNALETHVAHIIGDASDNDSHVFYIQIDIDRFRLINESCGCVAGDALINSAAEIINGSLLKGDFLSRIGGDRFGIITESKSQLHGQSLSELIKDSFSKFKFIWDEREFSVEVTLSIIEVDHSILSFDQLIMVADEVTFEGKKQGGNQIVSYSQANEQARKKRNMGNWALRLVDAIKNDTFEVFVQRLLPLQDQTKKCRFEALVRLKGADKNDYIAPGLFLHAAERYHLIPSIDKLVLEKACVFLSNNRSIYDDIDYIAVNLSSLTIQESDFIDHVIYLENKYDISASKIAFEVTETEKIIHIQSSSSVLNKLHDLGVHICIDDFGSGYSSYNYLKVLPFDTIKIDGVFIRDIEVNNENYLMVKSIVDLGKSLNKNIVAEFVENHSQLELLKNLGVDWGQGFHIHKPEPLTKENINNILLNTNDDKE